MFRSLLLLAFGLLFASPIRAEPLDGFDEAIRKALKLHAVPGLGVAIIKDGKVIHLKGYGVRELGKDEPVSEKTLFAIGSVSKSFTAVTAAMAIEENKLKWSSRIYDYLPSFQFADPYLSREVRMRDILSHRVGLDRHDMVWYGANFNRQEILSRVPSMKGDFGFRTEFVYNNILYLLAGQTVGKAVGKNWDEYLAEKVFKPLDMKTANTSIKEFSPDSDIATPHERKKGRPAPVPWLNIDCIGPAGSINASVEDMAKYVQFQLTQGKGPEKRLLKRATFNEMHTPQMLVPKGAGLGGLFNADAKSSSYGLGWFISDYAGKTLIEHGGNIDGMTAQVGFLPEENLGVVFLANLGQSALPAALMFDTFDRFLGRPVTTDRVEGTSLLMWMAAAGTQVAGVKFDESKRAKDAKLPVDLKEFAGKYEDDLYAAVEVTVSDDKAKLKWTNFQMNLEHWQHTTFRCVDPENRWPSLGAYFTLDENGKPTELRMTGLNVDKIRFQRTK
jgi:CubicO group peptidase (beta-lactamase class C family)